MCAPMTTIYIVKFGRNGWKLNEDQGFEIFSVMWFYVKENEKKMQKKNRKLISVIRRSKMQENARWLASDKTNLALKYIWSPVKLRETKQTTFDGYQICQTGLKFSPDSAYLYQTLVHVTGTNCSKYAVEVYDYL